MKIAILGTRGVPNYYGGFEQFAQHLSELLVKKGHEVVVYNPHTHPYQEKSWKGVEIIHCKDPGAQLGTFSQFIYDFNCIIDSRKRHFDIILQLGYTSSSIWNWLFKNSPLILTNMDGLEWKRKKYSKIVQTFLLFAEWLAIKFSDYLISDSKGIQSYLKNKYSVDSKYIAYGANIIDDSNLQGLKDFSLEAFQYNVIIARMEPENNIETIIKGFANSESDKKMIVIGSAENKYGRYIKSKYSDDRIVYLGYVSGIDELNMIRKFSHLYFHGHTVGGTNPSLLEAMGSGALICAHNNEFNKSILEDDAFYFNCDKCITSILNKSELPERNQFNINNLEKIKNYYSWESIVSEYEMFMKSCLENNL